MSVCNGESRTGEGNSDGASGVHSFMSRHTGSDAFKALFKEGMNLVETAASYLDGPGRQQAKTLPRALALAYATESMRLTTRLMQVASWLLLRRAVAEGELTPQQAQSEKHRVRLSRQEISCDNETYGRLPAEFTSLCEKSLRMQERILHLDAARAEEGAPVRRAAPDPVGAQLERLRDAFANVAGSPLAR